MGSTARQLLTTIYGLGVYSRLRRDYGLAEKGMGAAVAAGQI